MNILALEIGTPVGDTPQDATTVSCHLDIISFILFYRRGIHTEPQYS
jgi:hypothetical protein